MSQVLVGVCDEQVPDDAVTSWDLSKIGGKPDWMPGNGKQIAEPSCTVCGNELIQVVQVYCPLSGSPYHRTLYVFACLQHTCWTNSSSWKVYRCQMLDLTYGNKGNGMQSKKDTVAMDTWGDDADDWGDDPVAMEAVSIKTKSTSVLQNNILEDDLAISEAVQEMDHLELASCETMSECLPEEICNRPENTSLYSLIATRDVNNEATNHMVKTESRLHLMAYYMSVFDEPHKQEDFLIHEQELLEKYQATEGINLQEMAKRTQCDGSKSNQGGGGGEKYEKTSVKHGDTAFYKFQKRLQRCPEQVIRYHHHGTPVPLQALDTSEVEKCSHCGSPRCYELQLMPALVPILRTGPLSEIAVEFGSVMIYTCSKSCWHDDASICEETAIVQTDPDHAFFR